MPERRYRLRFVVDRPYHGLRIDTFLVAKLRNLIPAQVQRLAAARLVLVDDVPCPPDRRMSQREEVLVSLAEPPVPFYPPEPIPLAVLYDDPWLIAVNKPAGMLVHPSGPVDGGTLANAAQFLLDSQTVLPGLLRPGIVHRLDRETSGVIVIAKDEAAHTGLTHAFERSTVEKTYLALVAGHVEEQGMTIRLPIGGRPGSLLMSTGADALSPRPAETRIRVLRHFRSTTLVEARPRSGRKHQIRVHLAAIGNPILGDVHYGRMMCAGASGSDAERRHATRTRHALHAAAVSLIHPILNARLRIVAPVPADFWNTLASLQAAAFPT